MYRVCDKPGDYPYFKTEKAARAWLKKNLGRYLSIEFPDGKTVIPGKIAAALPPEFSSASPMTPRSTDIDYYLITEYAIHRLLFLQDGTLGADLGTAIFERVRR